MSDLCKCKLSSHFMQIKQPDTVLALDNFVFVVEFRLCRDYLSVDFTFVCYSIRVQRAKCILKRLPTAHIVAVCFIISTLSPRLKVYCSFLCHIIKYGVLNRLLKLLVEAPDYERKRAAPPRSRDSAA